jgi:hypothetical protein
MNTRLANALASGAAQVSKVTVRKDLYRRLPACRPFARDARLFPPNCKSQI